MQAWLLGSLLRGNKIPEGKTVRFVFCLES